MTELDDYDYVLPSELIAQQPAAERDAARLLVLRRQSEEIQHRHISDLPELLRADDCLVFNDTRVVPARLQGYRVSTGGRWEGLFLQPREDLQWELLAQTRGRIQIGEEVAIPHPGSVGGATCELRLKLTGRGAGGSWIAEPQPLFTAEDFCTRTPWALLEQFGTVPLPPYIERTESELAAAQTSDRERYQTVYARHPGSVAAPTAGLHFTPELLQRCRDRGMTTCHVTLHVGMGTFRPISAQRLDEHEMHAERCVVTPETVATITAARQAGRRIVAVGTTTVRTLESASASGELQQFSGETRIFIRPPYQFRCVDALLTNFHLPKSTLLVLLSALAGRERILNAYRIAVAERYRFFSYGDAMLVE